ncbi:DUF6338 family protein [Leisingera methylohalidivorans]|uniref:Uncharacterized protein n=1 Tax=Leisingera methylohalidivorans DSM 14336 TaxID=999552 RepID=V9VZS2_9RHOB|nr:DUF6338 family protein [Leisingera methylohalidivorans]AHD02875.1 hypothetical protein METH_04075 [Leisingera methylohalidivorans DSM 14336]
MIDLKSPEAFQIILYLVVPGLITTYLRAQFLTGRMQKHTDAILAYLTISLIYWASIMLTGLTLKQIISDPIFSLLAIFVGPGLFGLILGVSAGTDFLRRFLLKSWIFQRLKLNLVHPTPTAWDWKFQRGETHFLLITTSEGLKIRGEYGSNSFASNDPTERDLFIEQLYEFQEEGGPWKKAEAGKGILIRPSEIKYIEFYPKLPAEKVQDD